MCDGCEVKEVNKVADKEYDDLREYVTGKEEVERKLDEVTKEGGVCKALEYLKQYATDGGNEHIAAICEKMIKNLA